MAYGKGRRSRTNASSVKSVTTRKPSARNQKSQILSLSKKVNKLATKTSNISEKVFYQYTFDSNISNPYQIHRLVSPAASWVNVFGQSDNVTESRKLNITKLNLDFCLNPAREHAEIDYTVFLVTPKNLKVVTDTGNLINLVDGTDYSFNGGICLMNPKRFNVHRVWRCNTYGQITRVDGLAGNTVNSTATLKTVRRYMKMPFRHQLKSSTGPWNTIADQSTPVSSKLCLIAFNNNSAVDLENPNWKGVAHFTCYAS